MRQKEYVDVRKGAGATGAGAATGNQRSGPSDEEVVLWAFKLAARGTRLEVWYLPEAEEEVKDVLRAAKALVDDLQLREIELPRGMQPARVLSTLRKDYSLETADVKRGDDRTLVLVGRSGDVSDACTFVNEQAAGATSETRAIFPTDGHEWKLFRRMPETSAPWAHLLSDTVKIKVTRKGLRVSAPKRDLDDVCNQAQEGVHRQLQSARSSTLTVNSAQAEFLRGEGSALLRKLDSAEPPVVATLGAGTTTPRAVAAVPSVSALATATGVTIDVVCADYRETRVDAVVNSANGQLKHSGGIARAIASAAGPDFEAACRNALNAQPRGRVEEGTAVITGSGQLEQQGISKVVHCVAPTCVSGSAPTSTKKAKFEAAVWSALSVAASQRGVTSLFVPLIGVGVYMWPKRTAARLVVHTAVCWAKSAEASGSDLRRIVLGDVGTESAGELKAALDALLGKAEQKAPAPEPLQKPVALWSWYHHESKKWIHYDYDQNIQLEAWLERGAATPLIIMGDNAGRRSDSQHKPSDSQGAVYAVKRVSSSLSIGGVEQTVEFRQENIVSRYPRPVWRTPLAPGAVSKVPLYLEALAAWKRDRAGAGAGAADELAALASGLRANKRRRTGSASAGAAGAASGVTRPEVFLLTLGPASALETATAFLLQKLRTSLIVSEDVSLARVEGAHSFDDAVAHLKTLVRSVDATMHVQSRDGRTVAVAAYGELAREKAMCEVQKWISAEVSKLNDESRVQYPEEWEGGPFNPSIVNVEFKNVREDSDEYRDVLQHFRRRPGGSGPEFPNEVTKVERIQNPHAFAAYVARRRQIELLRGRGNVVEGWYKHGTSSMDPKRVVEGENSLDFRHSRNLCLFGRATYLAEDAAYSARGYTFKKSPTCHQMLLVRTLVGRTFKAPTQDNTLVKPPQGYDSVTGLVTASHRAVMVYNLAQAYAEYLISYKP